MNDKADHFYLEDMVNLLFNLDCKRTLHVKKKSDIKFENKTI